MEKQIIYTLKGEDEKTVFQFAQGLAAIIMQSLRNNQALMDKMKEKNIDISFIIK